jgi:hypothetical protein
VLYPCRLNGNRKLVIDKIQGVLGESGRDLSGHLYLLVSDTRVEVLVPCGESDRVLGMASALAVARGILTRGLVGEAAELDSVLTELAADDFGFHFVFRVVL